MSLRILFLSDGMHPFVLGGMQKHSYSLCEQLLKAKARLTIFHALPQGTEIDRDQIDTIFGKNENKPEIRSFYFPQGDKLPGHYVRDNIRLSHEYYEAAKTNLDQFDMIYGQGFTAYAFIKSRCNPPVFINFHGYEMFQKAADIRSKAEHLLLRKNVKWMSRNADYVFSFGARIKEILNQLSVPEEKQIEFPLGISKSWLVSEISPNRETRTFVFVGRYERRKGIQELNQAILQMIDNKFSFHFHFIGPISSEFQLEDERVEYHGRIDEVERIKKVLRNSDILVVPSYSEGMPTVILESMAQGLAVVGTDVGAISKMVSKDNGELIKAGKVDELYSALKAMLNCNDAKLSDMKQNSLAKFKNNFVWEELIPKLTGIFEDKIEFHKSKNEELKHYL